MLCCVPGREKYYIASNLSVENYIPTVENYIPTKSDFNKNPYIFGSISFRVQVVEKHSAVTNNFHSLAVIRKSNLNVEAGSSNHLPHDQPTARTAFLMLNKMQRTRLKMLFINTYALMLKGRPYSEYEHYIAMG